MNSNYWGGSELHWLEMAKYYCQQKKSVTCLVYNWQQKEEKLQELKNLGCKIIYIPNSCRAKNNYFQKIRYEWLTKIEQIFFIKNFDFTKYDFVYINQGGMIEVANSPWKNIYKKISNYVLTFHSYDLGYIKNQKKVEILKKWIIKAKKCFVATKKIETFISDNLILATDNFRILFNPLSIPICKISTPLPKLENGNIVAIVLAEYNVAVKAQDKLIMAIAKSKIRNENIIFKLFGEGKDEQYLNELIKKNNLQEKIKLMGKTKEVAKQLQNAHLLLQLTNIDAMPISVLEAMNMSRICLVSNLGDMTNWIKDQYNGFVSENAEVENIILTLERCLQDRNRFEELSINAFDTFKQKYPTKLCFDFNKEIEIN